MNFTLVPRFLAYASVVATFVAGASTFASEGGNPDYPIINRTTLELPLSLSLGFGQSLPKDLSDQTVVDTRLPSRAVGGESIKIEFKNPRTINMIRLTGYSASGAGGILIRSVDAKRSADTAAFSIADLFDLAVNPSGSYSRLDEFPRVFLRNLNYVELNRDFSDISFVRFHVEGYSNNDATLHVRLNSDTEFGPYDFKVTRESRAVSRPPTPPTRGSYFAWLRAQNGWGYCYEVASNGGVLNGGWPIDNWNCEAVAPSHYAWAVAQNGYTYCYQITPNGYYMNNGQPVDNYRCR